MHHHQPFSRDEPSLWKGALAGMVGGLIGCWAMNQFQAGLSKGSRDKVDDATMNAAEAISESVAGWWLTKEGLRRDHGPRRR